MADQICQLYEKYGDQDYIGESMTQIQHAVACASAAEANGESEHMIIAALLHDVGHLLAFESQQELMDNLGVKHHETIGADYLAGLNFHPDIVLLVASHVDAKRYLVSTDTTYLQKLSPASHATLRYQGGIMSEKEIQTFSQDPMLPQKLRLRGYDDASKPIAITRPFASYRDMMTSCIEKQI